MIAVIPGKRDGWAGEYVGRKMPRSSLQAHKIGSVLGNPYRPTAKTEEAHGIACQFYKNWLWKHIKGTGHESQLIRGRKTV